ncbi:hypothetical protein [Legionella maceachernii]|uniref:Chemiosmotic efflux system C protein A n=1 Tax=Legionella maceachernii TaxID=466 RepID=A0A0W0VV73_9GAMM|nr:hypothetical protein [Legionella maceachernii]KTD23934.1 hypothetical protein Lmac_2807 [Legionella maceachernii]SKA18482.1 hypothetical protein SAMN02745128_02433 [Legionella maceachernii]SUP04506.1 Uncharacterised protein [Legionella maceachernii]
MKRLLLLILLIGMSFSSVAANEELNQTLVRVIQQLNALMPLLDEAQTEIKPNERIQLHIESFEGADGKMHAGLRDDVLLIRDSLIDYINQPIIEPKIIPPLPLDFIGK